MFFYFLLFLFCYLDFWTLFQFMNDSVGRILYFGIYFGLFTCVYVVISLDKCRVVITNDLKKNWIGHIHNIKIYNYLNLHLKTSYLK